MSPVEKMSASDSDILFENLLESLGPRLVRALVSRYGVELGREAYAEAVEWGWAHRDSLTSMANPAGYLYRVAQTSVRSLVRAHRVILPPEDQAYAPAESTAVGLHIALSHLRPAQRVAVVLVHAHSYTYAEAAETLGIPVSALRNHVHRGLIRLRKQLREDSDD